MRLVELRRGGRVHKALGLVTGCWCVVLSFGASGAESFSGGGEARVDRVLVEKGTHSITLFSGERAVFRTSVAIGPGGAGPKLREGDQVTPVGRYRVIAKTPSRFRTFMRLDYPNAEDRKRFAALKASGALGKHARIGGDIGIHGPLPGYELVHKITDWTLGCVAVDVAEIDEIARRVPIGTPVDITD